MLIVDFPNWESVGGYLLRKPRMCQDIWFANHHTAFQRRLTANTTSPWDPRLEHWLALIWSWLARRLGKCTKKGVRRLAPVSATHSGWCRGIVLVVWPASYTEPLVIFKIRPLKNERCCCIEWVHHVPGKQSIWISMFKSTQSSHMSSPCRLPGWAVDLRTH